MRLLCYQVVLISHLSWNWRLSNPSKLFLLTWHCCEKGIATWYLINIPSLGDVLSFIQLNSSCFWGYNILHEREPSEHKILTGLVQHMVWYTMSLMWAFQMSSNNLQTMWCSPLFELNTYFLYCMLHCVLFILWFFRKNVRGCEDEFSAVSTSRTPICPGTRTNTRQQHYRTSRKSEEHRFKTHWLLQTKIKN